MVVQLKKQSLTTRQLKLNNLHASFADQRDSMAATDSMPDKIILYPTTPTNHGNPLTINVNPMIVIGRKRCFGDYEVNIDLTDFNGVDLGVSHYHAMILALDNNLYIKDIGSLNGSLINGERMKPSQEYKLIHGDIVTFGQLTFRVAFE